MLTDRGAKRRYSATQFDPKIELPSGYKFPESFEHIVDETKEIIGALRETVLEIKKEEVIAPSTPIPPVSPTPLPPNKAENKGAERGPNQNNHHRRRHHHRRPSQQKKD